MLKKCLCFVQLLNYIASSKKIHQELIEQTPLPKTITAPLDVTNLVFLSVALLYNVHVLLRDYFVYFDQIHLFFKLDCCWYLYSFHNESILSIFNIHAFAKQDACMQMQCKICKFVEFVQPHHIHTCLQKAEVHTENQ